MVGSEGDVFSDLFPQIKIENLKSKIALEVNVGLSHHW